MQSMYANARFSNTTKGGKRKVSQLLASHIIAESRASRGEVGQSRRKKRNIIMTELRFSSKDLDMYLYGRTAVVPVTDNDATEPLQKMAQTGTGQAIPKYLADSVDILQLRYKQGVEKEFRSTKEFNEVLHMIKTMPAQIQLCYSSIPAVGFGVCAKQTMVSGTWIGPYTGNLVSTEDMASVRDTKHVWEVYINGTTNHYIDGSGDSGESAWMKYIQCARNTSEQNTVVFQYGTDIYFQVCKDIQVGEELLVWYSEYYDQYLGVPVGVKNFPNARDNAEKVPRMGVPANHIPTTSQMNQPETPTKIQEKQNVRKLFSTLDSFSLPAPMQAIHREILTRAGISLADEERPILPQPVVTKAVSMTTYKLEETAVIRRGISPPNAKPLKTCFWKCDRCLGQFPQKWALQVHNCPCDIKQAYKCNQCSEMFIEMNDLRAHFKNCNNSHSYKCGYCRSTFAALNTLTKHLKIHSRQKLQCRKRRRGRISNYEKFVQENKFQVQ